MPTQHIDDDISHQEILEAIQLYATRVDQRFDRLENDMQEIKNKTGRIEAMMVTKDYLDRKLADVRGDLICAIKNVGAKVILSTELLQRKKIFSKAETDSILNIATFPRK